MFRKNTYFNYKIKNLNLFYLSVCKWPLFFLYKTCLYFHVILTSFLKRWCPEKSLFWDFVFSSFVVFFDLFVWFFFCFWILGSKEINLFIKQTPHSSPNELQRGQGLKFLQMPGMHLQHTRCWQQSLHLILKKTNNFFSKFIILTKHFIINL